MPSAAVPIVTLSPVTRVTVCVLMPPGACWAAVGCTGPAGAADIAAVAGMTPSARAATTTSVMGPDRGMGTLGKANSSSAANKTGRS